MLVTYLEEYNYHQISAKKYNTYTQIFSLSLFLSRKERHRKCFLVCLFTPRNLRNHL